MSLGNAHEGYEYQDLLTCYFILNEILAENEASFIIDRKDFDGDKLDDLQVVGAKKKYKKQIKYSNQDNNHMLAKRDLSMDSSYQLSLDTLYQSWLSSPAKEDSEFRLCLAWQKPEDELLPLLEPQTGKGSFSQEETLVYKIRGNKIWPGDSMPLSSWRRLRKAAVNMDRTKFLEFCEHLHIEVMMPKFSMDLSAPGKLERLVLGQARDIGIGVFPNHNLTPESFVLKLMSIIRRFRSKGETLTTEGLYHELGIKTDFGSILQKFPVVDSENLTRVTAVEQFLEDTASVSKVLLVDDPGSGKSWFLENLAKHLRKKNVKVVRHYCYTSLDDTHYKERIKTNVFYGNLIADIVSVFPELKQFKERKYASSLNELNQLLIHIESPTYLIVDGLDHIERIATFRDVADVNREEMAIIDKISQLTTSPYVTIVVASQNIPELEKIADFKRSALPSWTESDVKKLLRQSGIRNSVLKKSYSLSKFLLEKSNGNPLYIKYLIDELQTMSSFDLQELKSLPEYSINLEAYYQYLISRLNTREDVPRVLSGVGFSLTKTELQEITYNGEQVKESLMILSPVLKTNLSQSGYSIYHESFRRFIIDDLKSRSVSVEQKVFRPVREWFYSKDFFSYPKSYRYFLQFLYEGNAYEDVLKYLSLTFITESILNGQSWSAIKMNFKVFVSAASRQADFPNIVLLNELSKIIGSCQEEFSEISALYFETIGKIFGFETVAQHLRFEGLPTVALLDGLKACSICDQHQVVAPWGLYMAHFESGNVEENEMPYFVRGLLFQRDGKRLNRVTKRLAKVDKRFSDLLVEELIGYENQEYIAELCAEFPLIEALFEKSPERTMGRLSLEELLKLADDISKLENVYTEETQLIYDFFDTLKEYAHEKKAIELLINKFLGKNWFYNWLIYYIKILTLNLNDQDNYPKAKEAFDFLKYNVNAFEGKPRTSDLYSVEPLIYRSIQEGLTFLSSKGEWKETIDTLVRVSNATTTTLFRSLNGPLATDKLFRLLSEAVCEENVVIVIDTLQQLEKDYQDAHLHSDIARYNLRLAAVAAGSSDKSLAKQYFKKGIEFALGYTMRKDSTLMDCLEGIAHYAKTNPDSAIKDLKQVRILADSTVAHTDGKGTSHFPIEWFKSFLKIDVTKAMLYLANNLLEARYSWWAEESLENLLVTLNGTLSPEIECYLALTFPINDSENFISYCITLYDLLRSDNPSLSRQLVARIIPAMQPKHNRNRSDELKGRFNGLLTHENLSSLYGVSIDSHPKHISEQPWYAYEINNRKSFSDMNKEELMAYFDSTDVLEGDINSLCFLISTLGPLNGYNKQLILTIVSRNNRRYNGKANLDIAFSTCDDLECFYWVARFVIDQGGWMEVFVNQEAFHKAYSLNPQIALSCLFELLPDQLNLGYGTLFSANLLHVLTVLKGGNDVIEGVWRNILTVSSYRLPFQEDIEWNELLDNQASLTPEEILISILIARYRTETTERFTRTTSSLTNLMSRSPDKLIKPFQWFLRNRFRFLKMAEIVILQLIYQQSGRAVGYRSNFEHQLKNGRPSGYFLTDFIVNQLYNQPMGSIAPPRGIIYPEINKGLFYYLYYLNVRFKIFQFEGIDLEYVFNKYAATFNEEYKNHFELYGNRMYNTIVPHIYGGEHMMEILNKECYTKLSNWAKFSHADDITFANFLNIEAITTVINSLQMRPDDLLKPSELDNRNTVSFDFDKEWVRLGHYENNGRKERGQIEKFESYGGIIFSPPSDHQVPYTDYSFFPQQLCTDVFPKLEVENRVIMAILQSDSVEAFNIIWLNPKVVEMLGLTPEYTLDGFVATNNQGEPVLKMRTWLSDYLNEGYHSSISDEIPINSGTDLVIRKDYFVKLKTLFHQQPHYLTLKKISK